MSKQKLLVLHPALAPYRIDFFNALNKEFNASFYFFNKNLMNQKFDQEELRKIINFDPNHLNKGIDISGRSLRFGVGKIIKKENPDIIMCPEYNLVNIFVLLNKWFNRKNYKIYSVCDDSIQSASHVPITKKIVRNFLLRYLDGVILTHDEIRRWYNMNLSAKARLLKFPIIRDEKKYIDKLAKSYSLGYEYYEDYNLDGKKILLYVGRLAPEKNLISLLQAVKRVKKKVENMVLIIVGSGLQEELLREKVISLGLTDTVKMVGRCEGKELLAWYLVAPVCILPSTYESFGAVINEALLAGAFTLVSERAGGASLVKEGVNGSTFNPDNIQEISNTIENILSIEQLFKRQVFHKNKMLVSFEEEMQSLIDKL